MRNLLLICALVSALYLCSCTTVTPDVPPAPAGTVLILDSEKDSIEGYNRSMQAVNETLFTKVFNPVGEVYCFLLPEFLRDGIENVSKTSGYPLRLVNTLLQGKFADCWEETERFFINATCGVGGFFDPATKWGYREHKEDFGQTFEYYGIGSGCDVNLPIMGPTNVRDGVGMVLGMPFDILTWVLKPSDHAIRDGVAIGREVNLLLSKAAIANFLYVSNYDSYIMQKAYKASERRLLEKDMKHREVEPEALDASFGFMQLAPSSDRALNSARTRYVQLEGAESKLPYSCWPVDNPKQIIVLLPGFGTHRLSYVNIALAEFFNKRECAVIAFSSRMCYDFFQHTADHAPVGYLPADNAVLSEAITLALADYREHYEAPEAPANILGMSWGGICALQMAAAQKTNGTNLPEIRRFLAINPPVDMKEAMDIMDEYMAIPEKWDPATREVRSLDVLDELMLTAAELHEGVPSAPHITREEGNFILGLYMRMGLAECIVGSQSLNNLGVLKTDPTAFRKNAVWQEVMGISFNNYMTNFVLPYYQKNLDAGLTAEKLVADCNPTSFQDGLKDNPKVFVFENADDFLIQKAGTTWYTETFGDRATIFEVGGHMGNIAMPEYQEKIAQVLLED